MVGWQGVGQSEIGRTWAYKVPKVKVEDQAWWHGPLGAHLSVSESEWERLWLQYWGDAPLSLCPACLPHAPATQPERQPSCSPGCHAGGLAASFYDHSTLTHGLVHTCAPCTHTLGHSYELFSILCLLTWTYTQCHVAYHTAPSQSHMHTTYAIFSHEQAHRFITQGASPQCPHIRTDTHPRIRSCTHMLCDSWPTCTHVLMYTRQAHISLFLGA